MGRSVDHNPIARFRLHRRCIEMERGSSVGYGSYTVFTPSIMSTLSGGTHTFSVDISGTGDTRNIKFVNSYNLNPFSNDTDGDALSTVRNSPLERTRVWPTPTTMDWRTSENYTPRSGRPTTSTPSPTTGVPLTALW